MNGEYSFSVLMTKVSFTYRTRPSNLFRRSVGRAGGASSGKVGRRRGLSLGSQAANFALSFLLGGLHFTTTKADFWSGNPGLGVTEQGFWEGSGQGILGVIFSFATEKQPGWAGGGGRGGKRAHPRRCFLVGGGSFHGR